MIDASELIRVYSDACDFPHEEQAAANPEKREQGSSDSLHHRLESVQQRLDNLDEERLRERQQLQSQIDHLQEALCLAQDGHNKATLLLESRVAGGGEWETSIQSLETKISNQQATFENRISALQEDGDLKAIEEIKDKPWWRVVFG